MYCPSCGTEMGAGNKLCAKCGARFESAMTGAAGTSRAEVQTPGIHAERPVYAGFWRRFAAFVIDYVILVVGFGIFASLLHQRVGPSGSSLVGMFAFFGSWLYYALMESSARQATLGKIALNIKVTDPRGERIGFGRATGRYFGKIISAVTLGIGYVMVVFTSHCQALHDMLAGTLVVRESLNPEEIVHAGPAERIGGFAVALVIIAGILFNPFGIGILSAIAIPAYQNYTIRSQVAEGLSLAGTYKVAVTEAMAQGQDPSSISLQTLHLEPLAQALYVENIRVVNGVVAIEYGRSANKMIRGRSLLLIPGKDSSGSVVWICGRAEVPDHVEPVRPNLRDYTTVPDQVLPTMCH